VHTILLVLTLIDGRKMLRVKKELILHFVPFIGLTLVGSGWQFTLNNLDWGMEDMRFHSCNDSWKLPDAEVTKEGYLACGWESAT